MEQNLAFHNAVICFEIRESASILLPNNLLFLLVCISFCPYRVGKNYLPTGEKECDSIPLIGPTCLPEDTSKVFPCLPSMWLTLIAK